MHYFGYFQEQLGKCLRKGNTDSYIIRNDSLDTQEQVSKLLSNRAKIDKRDIEQFDVSLDLQLQQLNLRDSIQTYSQTYKEKRIKGRRETLPSQAETKDPGDRPTRRLESQAGTKGPGGDRPTTRLRYKNVNF